MKPVVLITERMTSEAILKLKQDPNLEVEVSIENFPSHELLAKASALLIRSRTKIDKTFLEKCPQLKLVVSCTTGFDHMDLDALKARGVKSYYVPQANVTSAAEMTWALVLACARHIPDAHQNTKKGLWSRERLEGVELEGKTYGVVGLGRVGSRVARIAKSFGMRVIGFDPYIDPSKFEELGVEPLALYELERLSDVVSLHVPLTSETRHMLRRDSLESLSPHAILINTSRGAVINERDLAEVLSEGHLRAVGLDVFEYEPLSIKSPLLQFPNVILSPHIGARTIEAFEKGSMGGVEKVQQFFSGNHQIADELPPQDIWFTHPRGFN